MAPPMLARSMASSPAAGGRGGFGRRKYDRISNTQSRELTAESLISLARTCDFSRFATLADFPRHGAAAAHQLGWPGPIVMILPAPFWPLLGWISARTRPGVV